MAENVMQTPTLKRRTDLHLARKIWHMGAVSLMFLCWVFAPEKTSLIILTVAWFLFVPLDFLRQTWPALNDWLVHAFKPIMRQTEVDRLAGTTYLITGVMVVAFLFPRPVVSLTLLFLAFADPLASYVGIRYGRDKIFGHKSLQGFIAAYCVCAGLSFAYLLSMNFEVSRSLIFSLLAGAVGALAELIPLGKVDDNFSLPVFSAMGLYGLLYFFGFFSNVF
ncbi:MAG: hypothetical protein KF802_11490 [Bdellovibrionaceae bacterium]|nr:hypothetical protein [Pseudobdellovibrionaceae bacterium]MBX3032741.1 hypothetical protein [Pseudobdellovibrionaceae bacterium]